ncbi:ankyrin repeat-containing domain protein [Pilobolus umbonatus]|nr:ankyrin repeat-containing domain protein [Pilobolus umbonatus]
MGMNYNMIPIGQEDYPDLLSIGSFGFFIIIFSFLCYSSLSLIYPFMYKYNKEPWTVHNNINHITHTPELTTIAYSTPNNDYCRLLMLPVELQMTIFAISQTPVLALVSKHFWNLSKSPTLRAYYLIYRYGCRGVFTERAIRRRFVSLEVVEQLLRMKGCDPTGGDDFWLFTNACELNMVNLAQWIIESTIRESAESERVLRQMLNISAMKGTVDIVDTLVTQFDVDIHQPNNTEGALVLACRENHVDLVKHLKSIYNCDTHIDNEKLLRDACLGGQYQMVELLLDGANVHAYNDAALQNATYRGHPAIVKRLLEAGANAQANSNSPIRHAITRGDISCLKYLVSAGADPRCSQDWPMKYACREGYLNIIDYLIQLLGEDYVNVDNGVFLEEALLNGNLSAVTLLVQYGINPNSQKVLNGLRTMMARSGLKNKEEIINILIDAGLDLSQPEIKLLILNKKNNKSNASLLQWV